MFRFCVVLGVIRLIVVLESVLLLLLYNILYYIDDGEVPEREGADIVSIFHIGWKRCVKNNRMVDME